LGATITGCGRRRLNLQYLMISNPARRTHPMAPSDQPDQADAEEPKRYPPGRVQFDMFELLGPQPEPNYDPDPEEVRAELIDILAKARAAPQVPWPAKEVSYWRTVFPQMANWLPEEEANRLRAEFAAEVARLQAA
jgi:hypothetical protein